MYSVVLMMALSGGPEAVDFGRGCSGCNGGGCHGAVAVCSGGGCHGSRGHGCSGCHGGGLFSRLHNRCSGCNGGCHTSHVSHGCSSSCSGCSSSCHGGGHGLFRGLFHRNRCNGCNGCHASACSGSVCTGSACTGCTGGTTAPETVTPEKKVMPKGKEKQVSTPATIVVNVPADAQVTFDGNATTSTSARRVFVTPALETGADYTYTLRAQVGEAVQTRNITVRGGETTNVSFTFEAEGVASR